MTTTPRKLNRRLAWFVVAGFAGAGAIWALAPGGSSDDEQVTDVDQGINAGQEPRPLTRAERLGQAMNVLRSSGVGNEAVSATAEPDLLEVLFSGDDVPARLGLVLTAIEANPTPPERDPRWRSLVQGISSLWSGENLPWGLDLMLSESRPRARSAVVASFASLAMSERARSMTTDQRQVLIDHFIDLYQQTPKSQQRDVLAAMRQLGAHDAAEVLTGKGLHSDDALEINRERTKALHESAGIAEQAEARESASQAQARAAEQAQAEIAAQAAGTAQAHAQADDINAGSPAAASPAPVSN